MPFGGEVENTGFHFQGELSLPGDSHRFSESKKILAMAFVSPWGSPLDGVRKVLELEERPEFVVPVHDWFYSDSGKEWLAERIDKALSDLNIKLISLGPGESVK